MCRIEKFLKFFYATKHVFEKGVPSNFSHCMCNTETLILRMSCVAKIDFAQVIFEKQYLYQ